MLPPVTCRALFVEPTLLILDEVRQHDAHNIVAAGLTPWLSSFHKQPSLVLLRAQLSNCKLHADLRAKHHVARVCSSVAEHQVGRHYLLRGRCCRLSGSKLLQHLSGHVVFTSWVSEIFGCLNIACIAAAPATAAGCICCTAFMLCWQWPLCCAALSCCDSCSPAAPPSAVLTMAACCCSPPTIWIWRPVCGWRRR